MKSEIEKLAKELGLEPNTVKKVYSAYWLKIKQHIEKQDIKNSNIEELSLEEFQNLRSSINISSLGKLYTSPDIIKKVKKRFEHIKKIKKFYEDNESEGNQASI
jgi:DNA-binding transcriptional regulator YhcF (GntR family)